MSQIISDQHVTKLTEELAKAAGITTDQASKVLKILHIEKLDENMAAHQAALSNPATVNALNMSQAAAKEHLKVSRPEAVVLNNLRLGIKPASAAGIIV